MDHDENFIIEKLTTLDPRRTGAIPRTTTTDYCTQHLPPFYWDLIEKINAGLRVCVILRGLPGSGKSFLGRKIIEDSIQRNQEEHIISADDYFLRNGRYQYDASKISEAHNYAQRLFYSRAASGYSPLIIDNTNMQSWELFPYVKGAVQYDYHLEIVEPQTPWKWTPSKLAQKNKHNVPMDKIKRMMDNYERISSTREFAKHLLNLDLVSQPKMRIIPPFHPKPAIKQLVKDAIDPIEFSFDENKNCNASNDAQRTPLSWQKFNNELQKQNQNSVFSWNPPPQIFEDKWDQPSPKEAVIKEMSQADENNKPQPQRKQRKNKKPSSPSNENDQLKPHRRNCPNENPSFCQLRELYPTIPDHCLWDFFEKCKGDAEYCADILCDENFTDQMETGDDLTCNCLSSSDSDNSLPTLPAVNALKSVSGASASSNKKQTPIKAKKVKSNTDEQLATKIALEESVRFGNEFYPAHVNQVKIWKGLTPQVPQAVSAETQQERKKEEDTLVAISIEEGLIRELSELFGGDNDEVKDLLDQNRNFKSKMFIKSSTAKQLYKEILETFYSHQEEAKLQEIENDRYLALMLHEQEKADKYPKLVGEPAGDNFKDIMATQAALKEYEEDVGEWQKVEKPETMAGKMNKEKLYKVFSTIDREMIDQIFEAQDRNFKKTIEIIEDSLGYTDDQRKKVDKALESLVKFSKESSEEEEEEFTPEEYACIKRVERLQEEYDHHCEEQMRCIQKSREHISKKEFETASYFTSMVNLHKQLSEEKRQELMNILAFSFLNNATSKKLDLHYFTQEGGKTRLHTFLDAHIAKLREIKKQYVELEIVTGRGAHSRSGPVLKNMTIRVFQERNLRYTEINPGMLKVKLFQNSMLYDEKQKLMMRNETN